MMTDDAWVSKLDNSYLTAEKKSRLLVIGHHTERTVDDLLGRLLNGLTPVSPFNDQEQAAQFALNGLGSHRGLPLPGNELRPALAFPFSHQEAQFLHRLLLHRWGLCILT